MDYREVSPVSYWPLGPITLLFRGTRDPMTTTNNTYDSWDDLEAAELATA
jgi:hypothetical protein